MRRSPRPRSASSARSGARFRPPPAPRSGCSKSFASNRRSQRRHRRAPAGAGARRCQFRQCQLRLSDPAGRDGGRRRFARGARRREGRDRRPLGRRQEHAVSLLLRFYDPAGTISLDGVPIRSADPREVRARIALVPQDSVAFATTARENIRFGRPDARMPRSSAPPTWRTPANSSAACRAVSSRSSASAA